MRAFKSAQPSLLTFLPSFCPCLCTQVPREHWWDSAPCCQPVFLKGIIVLSCCSPSNQWDSLFPLQHVGRGAPACTDVMIGACCRLSGSYFFILSAFRTVDSHISSLSQLLQETMNYDIKSCHVPSYQRFPRCTFSCSEPP